jgi:hypothetical protein
VKRLGEHLGIFWRSVVRIEHDRVGNRLLHELARRFAEYKTIATASMRGFCACGLVHTGLSSM